MAKGSHTCKTVWEQLKPCALGNLGGSVAWRFRQQMRRVGLESKEAIVEAWCFLLGSLELEGLEQSSEAFEVF